jgi:hypothetical protein
VRRKRSVGGGQVHMMDVTGIPAPRGPRHHCARGWDRQAA